MKEELEKWASEIGIQLEAEGKKIKILDTAVPSDVQEGEITLFSDEWNTRPHACQNFVLGKVGLFKRRIPARKCVCTQITSGEAREFIERTHIQGKNHLGVAFFGLMYSGELVGVLSLGRHHRQVSDNRIILDRLCFAPETQVIGGASKMLKQAVLWAQEHNYDEIITFSDNRWTDGDIYRRLGFILDREYRPDYSYVIPGDSSKRLSKQSQKKDAVDCPEGLTELQWATQRGLIRVYDLGKKRWALPLRSNVLTWSQKTSLICASQHRDGVFKHSHIRGYFPSAKNKADVYFGSSYELRCEYLLEADPNVASYRRCEVFFSGTGWRNPDLLVTYTDGTTEIIEIKPKSWLTYEAVKQQIQDSEKFCRDNGHKFRVWSEADSGLSGEKEIIAWAREFLRDKGDPQFAERKKANDRRKAAKHYRNKVATDTVTLFCKYCNEVHTPLRLTHDKNIERNGCYICEKEGGHIAGSKPKKKKVNPYAAEGKKQCNKCQGVLLLEEFGDDKTKSDGKATRCKKCRATAYSQQYHLSKVKQSL
jgi:hypothetical protein